MSFDSIALDTNLTLLLIVGRAERGLVSKHKRLRSHFTEDDFELLVGQLAQVRSVVTTPNALTEVSNIAGYGVEGAPMARVLISFQAFSRDCQEIYRPSVELVAMSEFNRLGLADCAWLSILDPKTALLTADNALYMAALNQGNIAFNFDHLRASMRSM